MNRFPFFDLTVVIIYVLREKLQANTVYLTELFTFYFNFLHFVQKI